MWLMIFALMYKLSIAPILAHDLHGLYKFAKD